MRYLFCIGPLFLEFAVDLAQKYGSQNCYFLATKEVGARLISDLGIDEKKVLIDPITFIESRRDLKKIIETEKTANTPYKIPSEVINSMIVADRRLGRGFVTGGVSRPDIVSRNIARLPTNYDQRVVDFLAEKYLKILMLEFDFIFFYSVSNGPWLLFAHLADVYGVPAFTLTHSRIGEKIFVDDDVKARCLFFRDELHKEVLRMGALGGGRPAKLKKPEYVRPINLLSELKDFSRHLFGIGYHLLQPKKLGKKVEGVSRKIYYLKSILKKIWYLIFWHRDSEFLPEKIHFFFPLHVDPESSTMVLSPLMTNQLAVIELIAKNLPLNAVLVVKEHLPMLGRRPTNFYQQIRRMPRVVLASPFTPSEKLIEKSKVTITITGTAAFEALNKGKSAVLLGEAPFRPIMKRAWDGNLFSIAKLLEDAAKDAPQSWRASAYEVIVERYGIDLSFIHVFGGYPKLSEENKKTCVEKLYQGIEQARSVSPQTKSEGV